MSSDLENLLAHSGWIRGLARQLARDGQTADDLVQDAWVVALRNGPGAERAAEPSALRRWAASVLRNLARERRRGDGRRAEHEGRAARADELPPEGAPDALLERLDEQEALAAAVRALDEPYRSAILLRYYEGLSPTEIAARTGVPLRTVHTRLNRGLHRLRERLGTERDGRTWSILALPWIGALKGAPTALSGGLIVKTKTEIAAAVAAAVAVAALGTWWVQRPDERVPAVAAGGPVAEELTLPDVEQTLVPASEERPERSAVAAEPEPEATRPAVAVEPARRVPVSGRVLDPKGRAVPGLRVRFTGFGEDAGPNAVSDARGAFTFEDPPSSGDLAVVSDAWVTVFKATLWRIGPDEPVIVVVAPRIALAGIVVDAAGAPIAGARVEAEAPFHQRALMDLDLEHGVLERWRTETDAFGRFELAHAPALDGLSLSTSADGYRTDHRKAPTASTYDLEIVLERGDGTSWLRGIVVDRDGRPIAGARIGLGTSGARSDADGVFTIELPTAIQMRDGLAHHADRLWVVANGRLPASVRRNGMTNDAPDAWPDPLRIVLDGEPLTIAGRVVDAAGRPVAGARVWTDDRTEFGAIETEQFAGMTLAVDVETLAAGQEFAAKLTTDDDGRFELLGLLEREYRISAFEPGSLRFARTVPVPAGTGGVVLTLTAGEPVELVAGRVVGLDGRPLSGLTVIPERVHVDEDGTRTTIEGEQDARTDDEGRFALRDLACVPDRLVVRGDAVVMQSSWDIPDGAALDELEVVVAQRCRFQVALDSPGDATGIRVLSADEEQLVLATFQGNMGWSADVWSLSNGRSEVLSVSELARTLVLTGQHGEEIRRIALDLVPGETVTVR